jgi:HTH-type transcriptional regulator / antitoxin HigA
VEVVTVQSIGENQAFHRWPELAQWIYVPHSDEEYERLVAVLDQLIDEVGEEESHPLASLMEVIGVLVERYENEHVAELALPSSEQSEKPERTRSIVVDKP